MLKVEPDMLLARKNEGVDCDVAASVAASSQELAEPMPDCSEPAFVEGGSQA